MIKNAAFILSFLCLQGIAATGLSAQSTRGSLLRDWEAKQKKKAQAAERAEIERFKPELERLVLGGELDDIDNMVETLRYSRVLGEEAKNTLISKLRVRMVVVLSEKANTQLVKSDFERARATLQRAEAEYDLLSKEQKKTSPMVGAVLAKTQYLYFRAISTEIEKQIRKNKLQNAQRLHSKATLIYESLTIPDPVRSDRAKKLLKEAKDKLRRAQISEILRRAKAAENNGDIRIARLLYKKAARDSKSFEAEMNFRRVEGMRQNPWLNLVLSAVVPGLGQLNAGRPLPAAGFFLGTGLTIGGGLVLAFAAEDRYDQYRKANDPERAAELYDGINTRWNVGLVLFGTAAALYLWNLIDVYVNSVSYNRENF